MSNLKTPSSTSEVCRENVRARYIALLDALQHPHKAKCNLIKACTSQSALAALSLPELEIFPLSRNSMYKYADELLADQFTENGKAGRFYLDSLRKQLAKHSMHTNAYRSEVAKHDRKVKSIDELRTHLRATEAAMLVRSTAYFQLIRALDLLANVSEIDEFSRFRIKALLDEHRILFGHLFIETENSSTKDNVEWIRK